MPLPNTLPSQVDTDTRRRWPRLFGWALLALGLMVALAYWPGLHGGYVFDDFPNIVNNMVLRVTAQSDWPEWIAATFSSPASDMQRPLAMLSFAINHALTGLDPYWMKLTNLGIHLLNTGLVFALSRRVLQAAAMGTPAHGAARTEWTALWMAAAWALNPINLMSVLFVVQRMESLSHTFVFVGLWLYLVGRRQLLVTDRGWAPLLLGLAGGTALGVLAKESAVLLPLYALALEWALLGFASRRQAPDRRLLGVFALVLALPGLLGLAWLLPKVLHADAYAGRSFSIGERLLTEARVVVDYVHWTLLPNLSQLSLYHDDYPISRSVLSPPGTLLALLLLAALLGVMVWLRKRRPLMTLGLAWFFAAHLLTATVMPLELVFEHRNYFASLGLCLVLADACLRAPQTQALRRAGVAAAMALLILYAGVTSLRAREWRDPVRFALSEAAKHPQSPRATFDVARNYVLLSGYDPHSPDVDRAFIALEQAMRVPNATVLPEVTAIILAARTGRPIERAWWVHLQHKLRTRPIGPQETAPLGSLVDCQLQQRCRLPSAELLESLRAALSRGPDAEVLNIYGNYALNVLHDPNLALQLWQEAAERAPREVHYQVTLAKMLIATGQYSRATSQIAKVRQLGRLGQNEAMARELEETAAQAKLEPNPVEAARRPR
jgi:hypothetical protein